MSSPLLTDDELAELQELDESAMPDELRLQTATTANDGLGHTYQTGVFTTVTTTQCRWKQLTGRDLEVARSLAATATGEIACPVGTPIALLQRFEVYQSGVLQVKGRVVWDGKGSYPTSERFYYEEVTL